MYTRIKGPTIIPMGSLLWDPMGMNSQQPWEWRFLIAGDGCQELNEIN